MSRHGRHDYRRPLIVSREAAEAAGLGIGDATLHDAAVSGRRGNVRFYALSEMPAFVS